MHVTFACGNLFSKPRNSLTWEFIFEKAGPFEISKNLSKITSYTVCAAIHVDAYLKQQHIMHRNYSKLLAILIFFDNLSNKASELIFISICVSKSHANLEMKRNAFPYSLRGSFQSYSV